MEEEAKSTTNNNDADLKRTFQSDQHIAAVRDDAVAVGVYYKGLIDNGISEDLAETLLRDWNWLRWQVFLHVFPVMPRRD